MSRDAPNPLVAARAAACPSSARCTPEACLRGGRAQPPASGGVRVLMGGTVSAGFDRTGRAGVRAPARPGPRHDVPGRHRDGRLRTRPAVPSAKHSVATGHEDVPERLLAPVPHDDVVRLAHPRGLSPAGSAAHVVHIEWRQRPAVWSTRSSATRSAACGALPCPAARARCSGPSGPPGGVTAEVLKRCPAWTAGRRAASRQVDGPGIGVSLRADTWCGLHRLRLFMQRGRDCPDFR